MAKSSSNTEKEEKKVITPEEQLGAILKASKEDHYNYEESHDYKIPCSTLKLTATLNGGLGPGAHRFVGLAGGGKTSCALDFLFHFLQGNTKKQPRRGLYIKSEGRLSNEVKIRSGVTFIYKAEDWVDGTCFVFESNIYEAVFKLKRELITNNPTTTQYFFITDSADSLIKREDAKKPEEESITVGGGSLITSVFLKKTGLAMAKRGHIDIYISQIRDQIKINQYEVTIPKQGKASGPRALEHQADVVIDFLPRYGGDLIREGDEKKGKIMGHFAKVKVVKSNNEKNMVEVDYPIRYGQIGGNSVWLSYELADLLQLWEFIGRPGNKGSWYEFDEDFRREMIEATKIEVPEKVQGMEKVRLWIEENKVIQQYLFDRFKDLTI